MGRVLEKILGRDPFSVTSSTFFNKKKLSNFLKNYEKNKSHLLKIIF
jgi:hypothetical protein